MKNCVYRIVISARANVISSLQLQIITWAQARRAFLYSSFCLSGQNTSSFINECVRKSGKRPGNELRNVISVYDMRNIWTDLFMIWSSQLIKRKVINKEKQRAEWDEIICILYIDERREKSPPVLQRKEVWWAVNSDQLLLVVSSIQPTNKEVS